MPHQFNSVLTGAFIGEGFFCLTGLAVWLLVWFHPALRSQPARLAPWTISFSDFLACALFVIGGAYLLPLCVRLIADWLIRAKTSDALSILFGAALDVGAIIGAVFASAYLRPQHEAAGTRSAPAEAPGAKPLPTWFMGVLVFLAAQPPTWICMVLSGFIGRLFHLPLEPQDTVELFVRLKSRLLIAAFIALAAITAPIAEELVFRAGLFRYMRTRTSRWFALLMPALLFAVLHVNWMTYSGWSNLLPLVALAIVFSLAYERTGRIGVTIIAHSLFNLNMILLILSGVAA